MRFRANSLVATLCTLLIYATAAHANDAAAIAAPLLPWLSGVKIHPVSEVPGRHTIHTYYITSPESPDGRSLLFYTSTTKEGYEGEIHVMDRTSGAERVLVKDVTVEDAHRAACQQWLSGGKRIGFHDVRNGQWMVVVVDVDTGEQHIIARDRQVGFGTPDGDLLPMYGPHWNPGEHRDLEIADVTTGAIHTALTLDAVKEQYKDWLTKAFADRPLSIFFPVLSPDHHRVFFKMASAGNGDFRSAKASLRLGLICYDLEASRFLFLREKWGHPAWNADSRSLIEPGGIFIDSDTGSSHRLPHFPTFHGDHPSFSPDGKLFITDTTLQDFGGKNTDWGIVVARVSDGKYEIIHRADNSHGARSWRVSHPHPVFSPDGKRIYFNVNSGPWTQLFVAESGKE
jgi:hypothetical protein